jgi:integrase
VAKGYFRKRGNKWSFTVDIGKDPVTGKRKQKTVSGFKTKKEAEAACNELLNQLNKGYYIENTNQTFAEYLEEWLNDYAKTKVKPSTFKNYKNAVYGRIIPALGQLKLKELKLYHGQKFINTLVEEGKSSSYVLFIYRILHTALEQAVKLEKIPRNPFDGVENPKLIREKKKTWSIEEIQRFLHVAKLDSPIYYICFLLAIHTGMRKGEVLGLRWQDIDFEQKRLSVNQSLVMVQNQYIISDLKTTSSNRVISLDDIVIAELKRHKVMQNQQKLLLGGGYEDNDLVCANEFGRFLSPGMVNHRMKEICEKAGVPYIRFHDLRHTHATLLLKLGENVKVVSERLGHSSVKMTLDVYSHVTPDMQEQAAQRFAQALQK